METKNIIEKLFSKISGAKESKNIIVTILQKIGLKNRDTSKSLFDMRLRKWKTIMAS
jgi:hypothetical protein